MTDYSLPRTTPPFTRVCAGLLAAAGLSLGGLTWAETASLPAAEDLITRSIEAMGGASAMERVQNRMAKGSYALPVLGIKGTLEIYEAAPDKVYSVFTIPGVGRIESGSTGGVYWENSTLTGPRILEGEERDVTARLTAFNALPRWKDFYRLAETVGLESVDGISAYRLRMTPHTGLPETWYLGEENGLPVRMDLTLRGPMGDIPMQIRLEEYRTIDGIATATRMRQWMMGMEQVLTLSSIEHDVELAEDRFDLPEEVAALIPAP